MELAAQSSKGINLDARHNSEELSPIRYMVEKVPSNILEIIHK